MPPPIPATNVNVHHLPPSPHACRLGKQRRRGVTACRASGKPPSGEDEGEQPSFGLDKLDPVKLGRLSRQAFDDVWTQFAKVSSPTTSFLETDLGVFADQGFDFQTPQAECTTVLVVGATGNVGKVLVRKLLLRGYRVKALVRNAANVELPPAVTVVEGDVSNTKACAEAVSGVDKVIYAAGARSKSVSEIVSVEEDGVGSILQALQNYRNMKARRRGGRSSTTKTKIADFRLADELDRFEVQELGEHPKVPMTMEEMGGERIWTKGPDFAKLSLTKSKNLLFRGELLMPGAVAEVGRQVDEGESLDGYEGIILRARGDGNFYSIVLTSGSTGKKYTSSFPTRLGYITARLPFNMFRPENIGDSPLELDDISSISLRFQNSGKFTENYKAPGDFGIEVDWIKLLPGGQESDVILVSCAGHPRPNMDEDLLRSIIRAKRSGETCLRNSGLGYTIVRATTLLSEPGGYKALVFDQGDRLSKGISAADAADVCVRSLHQPLARNKTFEVSQENTPEGGLEMYELVAHVPDKSTNYLGAALQNLEKNT